MAMREAAFGGHPCRRWHTAAQRRLVTAAIRARPQLPNPYKRTAYRVSTLKRANESCGPPRTLPNLDGIAPNPEIADIAARIRGVHRLRTPDALEAATAVHPQATRFVTNDTVFERVREFEALVLDDLV
jgi:predicted nucleic acid-binding protein